MDRRKLPVAALAAGLLLLILALSAGLLSLFCNTMYESDARKMGALTELYHEEEAAIAAIFNGRGFEAEAASDKNGSQSSISHSSDAQINTPENSGLAGSIRYEAEGKRLFEKYGYTLSSSIRSGSLWLYTAAMAAVLTAGVFLEVLLLIRMSRRTKAAADRAVFLEEKLQESHLRAEQMEEQLRREEQDTKALVTDISHQLKTPLASLKMSYELADSTDLSAEERREFAQKEREEVAKLESLLAVFTQLTRLETGMIRLRPENASLKETLTRAVGSIYMKAYDKQIDISVEEFQDIRIPHDPRWTGEIFVNILDNAVKYSPSGTAVSVRVTELASYVMVEIRDQGIGIPPSQIQDIFKRFYRGDAPEVQAADGSGVGLYLARKIIEQQGGTICVKPEREKGSNFILTLPKQRTSPVQNVR